MKVGALTVWEVEYSMHEEVLVIHLGGQLVKVLKLGSDTTADIGRLEPHTVTSNHRIDVRSCKAAWALHMPCTHLSPHIATFCTNPRE